MKKQRALQNKTQKNLSAAFLAWGLAFLTPSLLSFYREAGGGSQNRTPLGHSRLPQKRKNYPGWRVLSNFANFIGANI
jgi:hypothetical protein